MKVSVIGAAYNERDNLDTFIADAKKAIDLSTATDYEIIIVDDHSRDGTYEHIAELNDNRIKTIRFSRNFGSLVAYRAGLDYCTGDVAVCMATDGQDSTAIIPDMIKEAQQGNAVVWGEAKSRNETFVNNFFAFWFYFLLKLLIRNPYHIKLSHVYYFMISRPAINAIKSLKERNTSLYGLLIWMGFPQTTVLYERKPREKGSSKWNFFSRTALALNWFYSFSGFPLKHFSMLSLALLPALALVHQFFTIPVEVYALIIGINIALVAIYVYLLSVEMRQRPLYIVEKKNF